MVKTYRSTLQTITQHPVTQDSNTNIFIFCLHYYRFSSGE